MVEEEQELIESYILGAAMNDKYALRSLLDSTDLTDFFFHEHRHIYQAIKALYGTFDGEKLDGVVQGVFNFLKASGIEIPLERIFLISEAGHGANVDFYIDGLKGQSFKSKAYDLLLSTAKKLDKSASPLTVIDDMREKLDKFGVYGGKDFKRLSSVMENYSKGSPIMEVLQEEQELAATGVDLFDGFRSGYKKLDSLIGGFRNGTNNIIGARSSSGKTTLLVNIILNLVEQYGPKVKIGFFSLEMTQKMIVDKLLCTMASVPTDDYESRMFSPEQYQALYKASQEGMKWNLYFHNRSRATVSSMQQSLRMAILRDEINFVMTDYLTLIKTDKMLNNKHMEIDQISKMLQGLAKELNIPFVTLAQLNRNAGARTDKRPVMTDLRESGSIEEDADLVMLMHRPAQFDEYAADNTEILVAKNRLKGHLGKCVYQFDKGRLIEYEDVEKLRPDQAIGEKPEKEIWKPSNY